MTRRKRTRLCKPAARCAGPLVQSVVVDALQGARHEHEHERQRGVLATGPWKSLANRTSLTHASPPLMTSTSISPRTTRIDALHLAAIRLLRVLEERVVALQEAFQAKEKEFAHVVKIGARNFRTPC